jgi:hypothetical protein
MTRNYRKFLLSIILILLAAIIHILAKVYTLPLHSNTVILALYTIVILLWIEKNRRTILHKSMRKYLIYIGYLLIGYIFVRTLKYDLAPKDSTLERYLWYFYYVFILAIGVFLMFAVLYIDKGEDEKIDKSWNFSYLLLALFSLLFITNDLHQLIFYFPRGLADWSDSSKEYGALFYLIVIWCSVIILLTIWISSKKLLDKRNVKNIYVTFAVPIVWGIYTYFYIKDSKNLSLLFTAFKSPEFNVLVTISYIESLIYNRLIPVNTGYEMFWEISNLRAGIINDQGEFYEKNKREMDFDRELILRAESHPIYIDENTLLESKRISNGLTYFLSDISAINAIKKELKKTGDIIAEENELLQAENRLKEERSGIKKQIEIYEFIEKRLESKIVMLENCLKAIPEDKDEFREAMKLPTILNVYIKRSSNILLLQRKSEYTSVVELKLALEESMNYLNLFGIECDLSFKADGNVAVDKILKVYRVFEDCLEKNIQNMSAVMVDVKEENDKILLSMQIENPCDARGKYAFGKEFFISEFEKDNILYLRMSVPLESEDYEYRKFK